MIHGLHILAFVLAGGEGSRLRPLTSFRCKPAVPFNGQHRIVDFVLSNLVNSQLADIKLLVQYQAQALIGHVRQAWSGAEGGPQARIDIVSPQLRHGTRGFEGTADAVAQNLHLVERERPDLVAVFGADHVYRMDLRQMVAFHRDAGADASVATVPVAREAGRGFGVVEVDEGLRVTRFHEKSQDPPPMPGRPAEVLASMGNYLFDAELLLDELRGPQAGARQDFGHDLLPAMVPHHRLLAYDFGGNRVPGLAPHEDAAYWRDVGTIDAYFEATFDTLGPEPRLSMNNPLWPIHAGTAPAAAARLDGRCLHRCSIGAGSVVGDALLDHVVLRRDVRIEADARLDHCIVMAGSSVGRGARLRRTIVDQDNHVPAGERIGHDLARDRERFTVSDGGVVVVPRGHFPLRGA